MEKSQSMLKSIFDLLIEFTNSYKVKHQKEYNN
jgi:hypothetical protein